MKEDKYTKRLAKNQVCAILHMWDIRKNGLPYLPVYNAHPIFQDTF